MADSDVNGGAGEATVFSFGPEADAGPVIEGIEDLQPAEENEQEPEAEQTGVDEDSMPAPDNGDDGQFTGMSQKDIGKAFAAERKRAGEKARAEVENSATYKLGQLMVDDIMQTKGISREDAEKQATDNFIRAVAKRENISPQMARRLYGAQVKEAVQEESTEAKAERITQELIDAPKPAGFDVQAAANDPAFVELLQDMPVKAAIRVYVAENGEKHAKQDIAEKLQSRAAIPQMTRPQQSAKPKVDWTQASKEEFLAEKARRQKFR